MLVIRHLVRVFAQTVQFAVRSRRPGLVVLLVLGGLAVLVAVVAQLAAPLAIYPFI